MRTLKAICSAAALVIVLAPGTRADLWDRKTFLTFSGPVQLPGITLPAGTYTFKLADLNSNRHVVQIFDEKERKILKTVMAIPKQRMEATDETVVLFSEKAVGSPQAVRAWFYPGDTIGQEFVYPKRQAMAIAKASHTTVLASNDDSTDSKRMKSAGVGRVDENGRMSSVGNGKGSPASPRPRKGSDSR